MNIYLTMKERHQKEFSDFPLFFAFNQEQFDEGMQNLGLDPSDTDKIYSLGGGGYYRKSDSEKLHNMTKRHEKEMQEAMQDQTFIFDMFYYELGNHEYTYTGSITDTINSLGLTIDEINNNSLLLNGLQEACDAQNEWYRKNG